MSPHFDLRTGGARTQRTLQEFGYVLHRSEVKDSHLQKLAARTPVILGRSCVYFKDFQRSLIEDPHRSHTSMEFLQIFRPVAVRRSSGRGGHRAVFFGGESSQLQGSQLGPGSWIFIEGRQLQAEKDETETDSQQPIANSRF